MTVTDSFPSKPWTPRELIPSFREFHNDNTLRDDFQQDYREVMKLVKKYGCPISKVSDGKDWIRVYFEVPAEKFDYFIKEENEYRNGKVQK